MSEAFLSSGTSIAVLAFANLSGDPRQEYFSDGITDDIITELSREPERAVVVVHAYMRLDPYYQPVAPGWLGLAYYQLRRYADALAPLRECVSRLPKYTAARARLAATYAQLGLQEEARAEIAAVLRVDSKHTIDGYHRRVPPYKRISDAELMFEGLRKAGLPEK